MTYRTFFFETNYTLNNREDKLAFAFHIENEITQRKPNLETLLSATEMEHFDRLLTTEAQNSFILGKSAGKSAISAFCIGSQYELSIEHGVFGQPILNSNMGDVGVSLSHTNFMAFAMAFKNELLCGCDIEEVRDTNNEIIHQTLTAGEKNLRFEGNNTIKNHILWSGKESLSKAIKTGFLINIKLLEANRIVDKDDYFEIYFENFSMFKGIAVVNENCVITFVYPQKVELDISFVQNIKQEMSRKLNVL